MVRDEAYYRSQATRCRRLADGVFDGEACRNLRALAQDFDHKADAEAAAPCDTLDGPKD